MSKKECAPSNLSPCKLATDVCELKVMMRQQTKRLNQLVKHIHKGCQDEEQVPKESTVCLCNPCIKCLNPDVLYHLGLDSNTTNFAKTFGDVRFVVMGGTALRMQRVAYFLMKQIGLSLHSGAQLKDMAEKGHRFCMYKAGPVLCVSHGIGGPSISIVLQELFKLMVHAKVQDPIFIRIGTCGGIGIEGGSVIISTEAVDAQMRAAYEIIVHGRPVLLPSVLNADLAEELSGLGLDSDDFMVATGKTMTTNDFYEGQARLDGAFCDYGEEEKSNYLIQLHSQDVVNIEMEANIFAALTHRACVRAAILSVTLLDRLGCDQIAEPVETLQMWELRPAHILARYIRRVLYPADTDDDSGTDCITAAPTSQE